MVSPAIVRRHRALWGKAARAVFTSWLVLCASSAIAPAANAQSPDAASSAPASGTPSEATPSEATPSEATMLEARTLFEEGVRLSRAERWLEALDVFRRSSQLVDRPRTQFNMAIALDRLGRLRESIAAIDRFLALSDPSADEADRLEAARVRLACERRLVTLVLRITPSNASVEVDGDDVPGEGAERRITSDPGDHVVVVRRAGHVAFREAVSLPPGSIVDRIVTLEVDPGFESETTAGLEPALSVTDPVVTSGHPHEASLAEDPIFWIVLGAAVVAVGVGVGIGVYVATEPQPYGGTTGLRF